MAHRWLYRGRRRPGVTTAQTGRSVRDHRGPSRHAGAANPRGAPTSGPTRSRSSKCRDIMAAITGAACLHLRRGPRVQTSGPLHSCNSACRSAPARHQTRGPDVRRNDGNAPRCVGSPCANPARCQPRPDRGPRSSAIRSRCRIWRRMRTARERSPRSGTPLGDVHH